MWQINFLDDPVLSNDEAEALFSSLLQDTLGD